VTQEPILIGGRYELGELLGRGGMAEVRKGKDLRLGRTVAVKRLRTDLASDATFQARFRREAQSSASLNHPAIVSVYDTGEEMATDGSGVAQPYIVMECIEGRTLRDVLREGRRILPERALEITSGVLAALDYSHRSGIIHRDIKPGNVMLTPTGDVKVMDFGIARAISDASSTMTQTSAVVGTAQYLSPEQARGETVDSRSDVYSTGCLMYELLAGRPPFVGDSPVAVAYQHVREQAAPPSDHDDQLDPEIDAIVMKALAKRVEDRYQSAAAMRADIERYLAGHPIQAPPPPVAETQVVPSVAAGATTTMAGHDTGQFHTGQFHTGAYASHPGPSDREDTSGRTALIILIAVLAIALIAGAAFLLPRMFEEAPNDVAVPNLIGLTEQEARIKIIDANLAVGDVTPKESDTYEVGIVFDQEPNRDLYVTPGTEVDITVSTGKPEVDVPYLVGKLRGEARDELARLDLKARMVEEESDEPRNQVLRTEPAAGDMVEAGATVTVFWSDGPEKVPNVVGMKQDAAERTLSEAGFRPRAVSYDGNTTLPKGTVVEQDPANGTAPEDSTVLIFISTYEEPEPEPEPTPTEPTPTEPTPTEPTPTDPAPTDPAPPTPREPARID
jgi:beta-lactam-binding protein with PASTA domain/predicted Ser/Thr protein kinase